MRKTAAALMLSLTLLGGCASLLAKSGAVLADPRIPHRVAEEAVVVVWARRADGVMVKTKIRVLAGWWIAGPMVVEQ